MIVNVDHAVLRLHVHRSWEQVHPLIQLVTDATGRARVTDEDYTVCTFLNWRPRALILHVARDIPEFNVKPAELRLLRRCVTLKLDNPSSNKRLVVSGAFLTCIPLSVDIALTDHPTALPRCLWSSSSPLSGDRQPVFWFESFKTINKRATIQTC